MASTISGMIIGAKMSDSNNLPLRRRISTPMANKVPSTVASRVETNATIKVLRAADRMSSLAISAPYQRVEKPVQAVGRPPSLNDSATRTEIGT